MNIGVCTKPPSVEGGGKTQVLTEGEKEVQKLNYAVEPLSLSLAYRSTAPSSEGAGKVK